METRAWGLADSNSLQPGQVASTRLQRLSGSVQILLARPMGNTATGLSFWIKRIRLIIAKETGSHRKEKLGEKSKRLLWHKPIYRLLRKLNSLCWTKQQAQNGQKEPQNPAAFQSRCSRNISQHPHIQLVTVGRWTNGIYFTAISVHRMCGWFSAAFKRA